MIDIQKAIRSLDNNVEFVIYGNPTNEAEYKANVKYISGKDENNSAIFSDTQTFTWSEVLAKQTELQAEYNAEEWKRNRQAEYPTHEECIHALLDGGDTLTELQAKRTATKNKYPKSGA